LLEPRVSLAFVLREYCRLIESSFGSKRSEGVCFPRSNARSGLNQSSIMERKESEVSFQPVVWGVVTKASTLPALIGLEL